MRVVYAGIDEAGYGPMLGPLCVGFSAFLVDAEESRVPDLLERLGSAVCGDLKSWRAAGGRPIAVGDSKKLKLANSSVNRHPLFHLERGVLSLLMARGERPATDVELLDLLGSDLDQPEHADASVSLPHACDAAELSIASNVLAEAMRRARVEPVQLGCHTLDAIQFNEILSKTGTKASATASGLADHLRALRSRWGETEHPVRVVCDRLGGRSQYAGVLRRVFSDEQREVQITVIEESERISRYELQGDGLGQTPGRWQVQFVTDSERQHAPVAWASMTAKLIREIAMGKFNRFWCQRAAEAGFELKPTAGYVQDARRWLADCSPILSSDQRAALVRRA